MLPSDNPPGIIHFERFSIDSQNRPVLLQEAVFGLVALGGLPFTKRWLDG